MPKTTICHDQLRRCRPSLARFVAGLWLVIAIAATTACGTATAPSPTVENAAAASATEPASPESTGTELANTELANAEPAGTEPAAAEQETTAPAFFPLAKTKRQDAEPATASVDAAVCQAPAIESTDFSTSVDGDFDGDGLPDKLYLSRIGPAVEIIESRRELPPTELAVAFGDGGFATGLLGVPGAGEAEDVRQVRSVVDVVRIAGLGHDAIIIDEPGLSGAYASRLAIVHLNECDPEIIGWLSAGSSVANHLGWCTANSPTGEVIRTHYSQTNELQQGGAVEDRHLVWDGTKLAELWPPVPSTEPMCGPSLSPLVDIRSDEPTPGPLSGDHGLSLQWIGWDLDLRGTVRFIGITDNHYQVVGRQSDEEGSWVQIVGTVEHLSELELRFEGTIESRVSYLNDGEPCTRSGTQTFSSTQGRLYWRLQDLINCDGVATDYVDIYF